MVACRKPYPCPRHAKGALKMVLADSDSRSRSSPSSNGESGEDRLRSHSDNAYVIVPPVTSELRIHRGEHEREHKDQGRNERVSKRERKRDRKHDRDLEREWKESLACSSREATVSGSGSGPPVLELRNHMSCPWCGQVMMEHLQEQQQQEQVDSSRSKGKQVELPLELPDITIDYFYMHDRGEDVCPILLAKIQDIMEDR